MGFFWPIFTSALARIFGDTDRTIAARAPDWALLGGVPGARSLPGLSSDAPRCGASLAASPRASSCVTER